MSEPATPEPLAVAVTTKDNMRTIGDVLTSIEPLGARIVVVDSGSTDGTVEFCRERGCEVLHRAWEGPVIQMQFAIDQCREHRWVLLLDSDESLDDSLRADIAQKIDEDDAGLMGWELNRKTWLLGGPLNHTFQPEWRLRLFRGGQATMTGIGPEGKGGHTRVVVDGAIGRLRGHCRHDSWADLADVFRRHVNYAARAGQYDSRGGRLHNILFNPPAGFFKQYVLKQGFRDGWRGVIAAASVADYTLLKHLFIAQRRQGLDGADFDAAAARSRSG